LKRGNLNDDEFLGQYNTVGRVLSVSIFFYLGSDIEREDRSIEIEKREREEEGNVR